MADQAKLIALDLGERRIGLAVSGPGGMALPAGHLIRGKLAQDVQQVIKAAQDRQAQGIVVGIPYTLQGETGPAAKLAQGFIRALRRAIPRTIPQTIPRTIPQTIPQTIPRTTDDESSLAVYEMDERFTSIEAEGLLRESGVQPSRDRATVDEMAAVLILRRFMASQEA